MKWLDVPQEWKMKIIRYEMLEAQCGVSSNNPMNKKHKNYQEFLRSAAEIGYSKYAEVSSPHKKSTRERILDENTKYLSSYVKLLINDIFDLNNPMHKKIMLEVLDKGQSPFDLTDEEVRELRNN